MSELLVRDRTTGAGWQICSKLNRIKHCYETRTKLRDPNKVTRPEQSYETRTKPHSPDASTRLRQATPLTSVRGRQLRTVKACNREVSTGRRDVRAVG